MLSDEHDLQTCEDERRRVKTAGGSIDNNGRLNGDLAVSRAFGDFRAELLQPETPDRDTIETVDGDDIEQNPDNENSVCSISPGIRRFKGYKT
eukprot:UN02506